ncbi:MAG: hypothetical protein ACYC3X_22570 [Pirellulaceae bacterium]
MSRIGRAMMLAVLLGTAAVGTVWGVSDRTTPTAIAARYHLRQRTTQFFQRSVTRIPARDAGRSAPPTAPVRDAMAPKSEAKQPGMA